MPSTSATDDAAGRPAARRDLPETVLVGVVLRPHGVRGEVKVDVQSDVPERFDPGSELILIPPRGKGRRRRVTVSASRFVRGGAIVVFEGCDGRDQAEALRGSRLEVERALSPALPPGTYYYFELAGCRCFDAEEGELGEVVDLIEDGGGHLLRVQGAGRELLVPFVEAFLERVDIEGGRIDLRLPPGLVEICASGS